MMSLNGYLSDDKDAIKFITEKYNVSAKSIKSNIEILYEYFIKWVFVLNRKVNDTNGWSETIFRSSFSIALGIAQNNYKDISVYDLQDMFHKARNDILTDSKYSYLGLNQRIVPNDIPELYNIIYLYHDDLLYDFIIDSTTDKETGINDLKFHFNKYRKERIDRKKVEPKLYIGDGQFKKMEFY